MAQNITRAAVLAKIETTYGVDAAPTSVADAVLLAGEEGPLWEFVQKTVEAKVVTPYFGAYTQLLGDQYAKTTIQQELTGFGTAGPASPIAGYDALLQACGLARTTTTGTKTDYTPISTGHKGATIYDYIDGSLWKMPGSRGNLKLRMANGENPLLTYEMMSLFAAPSDAALPTPTVSAYQRSVLVHPRNTTSFTLHGYGSACLDSFDFDMGNQMEYRWPINCAEQIWPKGASRSGKVKIEANTVAQKDWVTSVKNGVTGAFSITHGQTAGNKIVFTGGKVQLLNPKYSNGGDNSLWLEMDMVWQPTSGNDDFTLSIQ
ncbi:phage tail tube protein [Hydrocarboniphaga sp.]|uniref:phage tail tube protein n=1 Tax=Hydrocarboniphaga sp. TaxID=2033016 RepID=UPI003D121563